MVFLVGLCGPYGTADIPSEIFQRVYPAIVAVRAIEFVDYSKDQPQKWSAASGVIIRDDGHFITNFHAVEKAVQIEATLSDNSSYSAKIIGTDPDSDLALLRLTSTTLRQFPLLKIASDKGLKIGQKVFTIGNPSQLSRSFSAGIISGLNRAHPLGPSQNIADGLIQVDAVVIPGSSGGALLTEKGRFVGLTSLQKNPFGLSIPASRINQVLPHLFKYGKPLRPNYGMRVSDFPKPVINKKLGIDHGVTVTGLDPEGLMAKAGLQRATKQKTLGFYSIPMKGDIIYLVDNTEIRNAIDLKILLSHKLLGEVVTVHFIRNDQLKTGCSSLLHPMGNDLFPFRRLRVLCT